MPPPREDGHRERERATRAPERKQLSKDGHALQRIDPRGREQRGARIRVYGAAHRVEKPLSPHPSTTLYGIFFQGTTLRL